MVTTPGRTSLEVRNVSEGETIEQKVDRMMNNNEPITDSADIIYTERREGILPGYNIRTDRFDVAIDAMTAIDKTFKAKREDRIQAREAKVVDMPKTDGGAETTQGTN